MAVSKKSLAVFVSGFGSNLQVFIDQKDRWQKLIVVSSKKQAPAVARAQEAGLPVMILEKKINWATVSSALKEQGIELVFLAGFMKIVPAGFIESWQGRIFNLHPSMLPKFKGLKAIEQAIDAGDDIGVSIHHVAAEVDSGVIVEQEMAVSRSEIAGQSLEAITEKVHQKEHELVSRWIQSHCS